MSNRRAHAVLFGFDFQVNAAIVLMLENIKELKSLRLEGNYEDIELTLGNDQKILAQAKSVENASSDFANVRANLKKALTTLSEGAKQVDAKQLILITNSPNPFKDDNSRSIFWGPTRRAFSTLPSSAQQIVTDYMSQIDSPLDPQKFTIQFFHFETDDDVERYKVVAQTIDDFIGSLNANTSPGLGKKLLQVWHNNIFVNGSKKNAAIELDKKEIIWPIIVLETDISRCDERFIEQFDLGVYDEVVRLYGETIDSCCERIDFFTQVLYDYNNFPCNKRPMDKCLEFVNSSWESYKTEFAVQGIDDETLEALTKTVLYNVVRRRIVINKIKQGVNL